MRSFSSVLVILCIFIFTSGSAPLPPAARSKVVWSVAFAERQASKYEIIEFTNTGHPVYGNNKENVQPLEALLLNGYEFKGHGIKCSFKGAKGHEHYYPWRGYNKPELPKLYTESLSTECEYRGVKFKVDDVICYVGAPGHKYGNESLYIDSKGKELSVSINCQS